MISWETQYELGIKSIDDQHKELVNIINKMAALLIEAKQGVDIYDEVVAVIGDLKKYTIYHFKYEENLFDQYSYEYKDTHKAEHDKLVVMIGKRREFMPVSISNCEHPIESYI